MSQGTYNVSQSFHPSSPLLLCPLLHSVSLTSSLRFLFPNVTQPLLTPSLLLPNSPIPSPPYLIRLLLHSHWPTFPTLLLSTLILLALPKSNVHTTCLPAQGIQAARL